jgi:SAM-dependent methyltransferase
MSSTLLADVVCRAAGYDRDALARDVIGRLDIEPDDAVLEIGCGSGRQLLEVTARARRGFVAGVDPSELMLRHARHRNRRFIQEGRLRLVKGRSSDLSSFEDARFDKVYAVDVVHFWSDPRQDVRELSRDLRPGGRLLLGYGPTPGSDGSGDPAELLEELLREQGFSHCDTESACGAPLAWTLARRPARPHTC